MTQGAFAVFLRAVNVGGHNVLKPAALARELASDFDVANVGAAGTFVVRGAASAKALRAAVAERLPFEADVMVCPASDVAALLASDAARAKLANGQKRFVSVLEKSPARAIELPIARPDAKTWQVRVVSIERCFALSVWRRTERGRLYPNEVVEKALGLRATTRGWDTIAKVGALLAR